MPIFPKVKKGPNGTYGPTKNGHYYFPVFYHNNTAKRNSHKSTWCIKENQHYEVFRLADEGEWECLKEKGLFSILDRGEFIVGNDDEILSFFPNPANGFDCWHGFPVKSLHKRPSSELLDEWVAENVIGHSARIRIEKGLL